MEILEQNAEPTIVRILYLRVQLTEKTYCTLRM